MARMLDLRKSCLNCRLEHCNWVAGAQLDPRHQARLLVIGCILGELDTEISPQGRLIMNIG